MLYHLPAIMTSSTRINDSVSYYRKYLESDDTIALPRIRPEKLEDMGVSDKRSQLSARTLVRDEAFR